MLAAADEKECWDCDTTHHIHRADTGGFDCIAREDTREDTSAFASTASTSTTTADTEFSLLENASHTAADTATAIARAAYDASMALIDTAYRERGPMTAEQGAAIRSFFRMTAQRGALI
jgi:hypothetical protein